MSHINDAVKIQEEFEAPQFGSSAQKYDATLKYGESANKKAYHYENAEENTAPQHMKYSQINEANNDKKEEEPKAKNKTFYKEKIHTLRETLRGIKDKIKDEDEEEPLFSSRRPIEYNRDMKNSSRSAINDAALYKQQIINLQ